MSFEQGAAGWSDAAIPRPRQTPAPAPIRVGISACILGEPVRYNGGHKLDRFIRETLGKYVEFVAVCPEVEVGMGIPREALRLVERAPAPQPENGCRKSAAPAASSSEPSVRLVTSKTGADWTDRMLAYAQRKCDELASRDLCGYILQRRSPSCGMARVRVYPEAGGQPAQHGRGLFAQVLLQRLPTLPIEEDGRLNDPMLRENFIERVFAYRRLRVLLGSNWRLRDLVAFHSREKMLLLGHDPQTYQQLGRLVGRAKQLPRAEVAAQYERLFMAGLQKIATRKKQTNVLQHIMAHFSRRLDAGDREELHEVVESYRIGLVPLVVPLTLVRHHIRRLPVPYLEQQTFLEPHPRELMLRNHA